MKRRGFLKFLGMVAAVPVMAPLAEQCLRAAPKSKPDGWNSEQAKDSLTAAIREGKSWPNGATMSCVSVNALSDPWVLKPGDIVTIGDDPTPLFITKAFRHGEQS